MTYMTYREGERIMDAKMTILLVSGGLIGFGLVSAALGAGLAWAMVKLYAEPTLDAGMWPKRGLSNRFALLVGFFWFVINFAVFIINLNVMLQFEGPVGEILFIFTLYGAAVAYIFSRYVASFLLRPYTRRKRK